MKYKENKSEEVTTVAIVVEPKVENTEVEPIKSTVSVSDKTTSLLRKNIFLHLSLIESSVATIKQSLKDLGELCDENND